MLLGVVERSRYTSVVRQAVGLAAVFVWTGVAWGGEPAPAAIVAEPPKVRLEVIPLPDGAELLTWFRDVSDPNGRTVTETAVPFVSILRDTLGDSNPENDRLRDVWVYTYSRPSVLKRVAASVPFLYRGSGAAKPSGMPPSLIDLGNPSKGIWKGLTVTAVQANVLDPRGFEFRATTRSYRNRFGEYRSANLWRALSIVSGEPEGAPGLTEDEADLVRGRLLLARRIFGGLVDSRYAPEAWHNFESDSFEWRGRNWELLRQRAEANHLYFQPLGSAGSAPAFAMLWMDKSEAGADVSFDSRFLGISDPFRDPKILDWKDYTETWELDENGAVQQGREGGRPAAMIPLALYSLDHPRVPLLLVDFRDSGRARRREVVRRAADDVATGVFGLTGFGNWTYLAAKTSWSFIHNRHGAALDRDARLRATVLLKQELLENHYLSPALRRELARHLDKLEINPLGQSVDSESTTARLQYETLKREAQQGRFAARLAVLRNRDAAAIGAGPKSSTAVRLARVASLGLYRPQPAVTPELLAQADLARRIAWHRRYLENVLAAGPRPEISFDMRQVMRSVNQLVTLSAPYVTERDRTARMISALMANTGDSTAVAECAQGLNRLAIAMTDGAGTPSPAMTPIIETRGVGGQ